MTEALGGTYRFPVRRGLFGAYAVPSKHLRSDIQGLRAVAVLAVLLSHIWPDAIPGGFIGVDVFFVISGYLITGLLYRELQQTGRIALLQFYLRRMKRLLPAATLVLVVVGILTIWLLPPLRWEDTAIEILASAFYVENWRLAWLAVDYFGAEDAASPVQHYWSLSIEEQFYIVWPLMMITAGAILRRFVDLRTAVMLPLLLIVTMSFSASVLLTEARPEEAYFLTHTRIWQLALGGVLAVTVLPDLSLRTREAMRMLGLAAIVIAVFCVFRRNGFSGIRRSPSDRWLRSCDCRRDRQRSRRHGEAPRGAARAISRRYFLLRLSVALADRGLYRALCAERHRILAGLDAHCSDNCDFSPLKEVRRRSGPIFQN